MALTQTTVNLTAVSVGQRMTSALVNGWLIAIQELQQLVNKLEAQPVMEQNANSSPTVSPNTWSMAQFNGGPSYSVGSGLTGTNNGIQCLVAGRYQVQGTAVWAGNTTGARRLVGVAISTATGGPDGTHYDTRAPLSSSNTLSQSVNFELTLAVNQTVSLWVFHDATTSLSLTDARISARLMTD